ncbi:fasciclin domain-containing protein [Scytonema sp. UIC 10036]|uniref:fasciclin domain-containing protein n=1 Tax=Scytonema sp. UIC 10036 TaxID=2304196 RepID=UPI0012DAA2F9|nr:fasciclin domain-containing protein [Scytonema sp. UIC 10036]MUH00198.1 fasciclin domain-containing protein [Scytonema sp. UIC 10036]
MNVKYGNLLKQLASIVGVTGVSLMLGLSVGAKEVLNPNPSIFNEMPYNKSLRVGVDSEPALKMPASEVTKSTKTPAKNVVAQGGATNPRPSILQECPYNRAACPGGATSPTQPPSTAPDSTPPSSPTETPTTPTTPTIPPEQPSSGTSDGKDIVAVAESNGSFTMLTKALRAAGLAETLQGKGPFTVFAPTDAAFAKLPQDAVQDLLKPEHKETLTKILKYHVVSGSVQSGDLKSGEVKSVEGGAINVKVEQGVVMVNEAKVVQPDVKASNGIIHVIDNVILPPDL